MTPIVLTPAVLDSLYDWLCDVAAVGVPCPANKAICERYGLKSWATAASAIKKLEKAGRITVVRANHSRCVTIVATGLSTAPLRSSPVVQPIPTLPPLRRPAETPKPLVVVPKIGRKGRQCQWIEAEPTGDDACKCLAPTAEGRPYCPDHQKRVTVGPYVPRHLRTDEKKVAAG